MMANRLRRLLQRCAAALITAVFAAPAETGAGAATVLGEHYSDDAHSSVANCFGSSCVALFPTLPTGKGLAITSVACRFTLQGNAVLVEMRLYTLGSPGGLGTFLKPVILSVANGVRSYQTNDTLLHLIPVGSRPAVYMQTVNGQGDIGQLRCHMAGVLRP